MMACAAALKAVSRVISTEPKTAEEIFSKVNWWTFDTIAEALQELGDYALDNTSS
jgi:hypothetical protein